MKIVNNTLTNFTIDYPIEKLAAPEHILFIDIETTGFTARSAGLYLIGCAYYESSQWHIIQWLAQSKEEEKDLLEAFFTFASRFTCLIHYNGNNFDLPFLEQKCAYYELPYNFKQYRGIDLYRRISPYKTFLHLENCKQKTIESFLDIKRDDTFTGGELIGIYNSYLSEKGDFEEKTLLLHNFDDVKGMLSLVSMLAYYDMLNEGVVAKKVQANYYVDFDGVKNQELLMHVILPSKLPKPITGCACGCYFSGNGKEGIIKVPIFEGELKYFYANYKDYYYLPSEDIALHKSVADFVDKEHREQATASTCYTRKSSVYLPEWEPLVKPFFKKDYKGSGMFFELLDEIKRDRKLFADYASHIIQVIAMK